MDPTIMIANGSNLKSQSVMMANAMKQSFPSHFFCEGK